MEKFIIYTISIIAAIIITSYFAIKMLGDLLVELIEYILKGITLIISSAGLTGFLPWLFGKRGKLGGSITSIVTTLALLYIHFFLDIHFTPEQIGLLIAGTFVLGLITIRPAESLFYEIWGPRKKYDAAAENHESITDRDYNETTIDEVHGVLIPSLCVYYFDFSPIVFFIAMALACGTFRYFDVKKPWPIKWLEEKQKKMPIILSPLTIMIDDTIAGIYAMAVTLIGCLIIEHWKAIAMIF